MKHSLINPNQVCFRRLNSFDNTVCDEELYIGVYDETKFPLQFKGTKCVFKSRVPTRSNLESCPHDDMMNDAEWNPHYVDLRSLRNISEVKREIRAVYQAKRDMVYAFPSSNHTYDIFAYSDTSLDESILTEIYPSLVQLKDLCIRQNQRSRQWE